MIINEEIHEHEKAAETIKRYEDIIKKRDYKRHILSRKWFLKDRHTAYKQNMKVFICIHLNMHLF